MQGETSRHAQEAPGGHPPLEGDERAIQLGIDAARAEDREVTDAVARAIAVQLHDGQGSALYSLASTGDLEHKHLDAELHELYQSRDPRVLEWASVLGTYALHREHKGPVEGWYQLWPDQVHTATHADEDGGTEIDAYPWRDAARWQPGGGPDELADEEGVSSAVLSELFAREPDATLGAADDMGWFGLVRYGSSPGGAVIQINPYGRRSAWVTDSDDELLVRWHDLQEEHGAYLYARQARSTEHRGGATSPHIWVGSLADYAAGYLHGAWLDAALDPDDLAKAVQFVLRNSHERDGEEFGIFDYEGFGSEVTSLLGEYPSLKTVSKIAQGIAEHGQAFAAWAAYVGPEQTEQLDRFEDHYLGEWDSMHAYAEHLLEECEGYRVVDDAPEWLRPYLKVDVEGYSRDLGYDLHVVERPEGGVWVFDPRC
ncbi:antirestriction protein ArdA [Phytohabitans sp. ZYX-F-186]|uniref:Antirestriction protein ArdA n=1 Tax=Phytohabitans maris TaxID=3071409 RepID=A0ABU0Z7M3_9ACTN|nr:antirestriction protein ArdA [Phytohabitans sp. ZYX-F-186]MDQ7903064.1 antirestriction protein ArdA [Phytohabitans sp. ZYX-F-186]